MATVLTSFSFFLLVLLTIAAVIFGGIVLNEQVRSRNALEN